MKLSLFLRGKTCCVATDSDQELLECKDSKSVSDEFVPLIEKILDKNEENFTLIVSSGPSSFTSVRVLNSIAKGILIVKKNAKVISVSSFLPYLYAIKNCEKGVIAISTMRGDFFCMNFSEKKLSNFRISSLENLNKNDDKIFFDNDKYFDGVNFAKIQIDLLDDKSLYLNEILIKNELKIDYGFEPEYKTCC